MNVLDNKLGYTNTILLVLEGSVPRFSNSLYAMLRQMTSIFGETWWDFMMIGVRYSYHLSPVFNIYCIASISVNGNIAKEPLTKET